MGDCKTLSSGVCCTVPPPPPLVLAAVALFFLLQPSATPAAAADLYGLVYKGCATQTFSSDGGAATAQQALGSLASALIAQSAASKFYKTTVSAANGQPALFGLFQCRGDISPSDCAACVGRIPTMWVRLCGQAAAAARVQLNGCYGLYEVSGFPQVSGTKMLYKTCGSGGGGGGFEEKRDTAFANLESVMASGRDLSVADCAECVTEAVQKVEVECGGAVSGQMYLDKCYLAYGYSSNGVPHAGSGGGQPTGKTVAIVVGGAAGVGFLVICLLFARSLYKKRDDY
ncbi:unnamed protein product [Spirodela intermedia]|uniref:Gnk2-homologous domain-containing protein n=1 Tax=Spirodela intermedia TaxID=51605 RepID=A0A7I8J916_SPIIN|nr:unnamed protein product [Spirodela intermedia]CAA6666481.1 unnamed protein product [Spirodela intermedia]